MTELAGTGKRSDTNPPLEASIRLGLVALLLFWAYAIIAPFIHVITWSSIIAVAVYPLFLKLRTLLGGRNKLAAILFTLIMVSVIIVPSAKLAVGSMERGRELAQQWQAGTLVVPAPADKVKDWPLIGERVYSMWLGASRNLAATVNQFEEPLKELGAKAAGMIAGTGGAILMFTFSLIIAGVLMANAEACRRGMLTFSRRVAGDAGDDYVDLATATVRSVAQGVLGIAFIQAFLSAIGLVVMGIPLAGLWALGVLFLATIQLPPILILGPIAAYAFSAHEATPATIFAVYCVAVSVSDTFLKPLLLGRGVEVPMLVILLGAIGGVIMSGIIGLFVGAVILGIIYRLFTAWLYQEASVKTSAAPSEASSAKG